jgi:hypothetical protein
MGRILGPALAAAIVLALLIPTTALAHERRDVGRLRFVVGWATEPALLGQPNGVSLTIADTATGTPVEGAEKSLKLAVAFGGGQPREFPLRARHGQKGAYLADIIPTRAGSYVFRVVGTAGDQPVDEQFESGPGRFDDVEDAAELQFPEVVPSAGDQARQLQAVQAGLGQANTLVYLGAGLGALGVVVALGALLSRRAAR